MSIDKNQVKKVAKLSRISLEDSKLESLSTDLASILNFVEQLNKLDTKKTELVSNLLLSYSKKKKISLFLVTHNINLAKKCDRVINLFDGQIKN